MPTWLIGTLVVLALFVALGGVQLIVWFVKMKFFINRPRGELRMLFDSQSRDNILFIGDSIATGYGAETNAKTLWGRIRNAFRFTSVEVRSKPFKGISAVPGLLNQADKYQYHLILISEGGNDCVPFIELMLTDIERALEETILAAKKLSPYTIILGNFDGLGMVYPAWSLRLLFRRRGKRVRAIYERLCKLHRVCLVDIGDVFSDKQYLARDGVHPNDEAFAEIFKRIKPLVRLAVA